MEVSVRDILDLAGQTLREPREAARRVLAMDVASAAWWQALALIVILSLLLSELSAALLPGPMAMPLLNAPLLLALVMGGLTVLTVFAVHHVGRIMGGTGEFHGALALTTWLQAVMLLVQAGQFLVGLVLPPLAGLIGIAAVALSFWLLTNFVAVLHGFASLGKVFAMILVTGFAVATVVVVLLVLFGISLGPEAANAG